MGKGQERQSTSSLAQRWLLDTILLFAAMAAPFFLFDVGTASSVAFWAAFTAIAVWLAVQILRDFLRERGKPKQPVKIRLLLILYRLSVPVAVEGLALLVMAEWGMWAYLPITGSAEIRGGFEGALIVITALLIYPPILFLLLTPLLARKDGGPASRFLNGIRARGFGWFQIDWLSNTIFVAGLFGLFSVLWTPALLHKLERWRDGDGVVTNWELVAAYPFLPFALLAVAAMLALGNFRSSGPRDDDSTVRAYADGAAEEPRPDRRTRATLSGLVAGACVATLLIIGYPLHLGITTTGVWSSSMDAIGGVSEAWATLENTHEDDGWTDAEFVDAVNRYGRWTPDAPGERLGALVAGSGEAFPDTCAVRIAAGNIDPTDPGPVSASAIVEARPGLKFCIAVACAPPTTWSAPPALILVTSHESRAEGWRVYLHADIFAEGRAPAPGGYCTADGGLADNYQG
jgi:hypothetical protein